MIRNFLREGLDEGGWSHLVKCEVVVKSVELGGLGIGNLRLYNVTRLCW